jgi:hypothetical protein
MVLTEGGFFHASLNSRFEECEAGLDCFDHLTDLVVQHDLWAFVMTTYNGPEVPVWWACPKWLAENNDRFMLLPLEIWIALETGQSTIYNYMGQILRVLNADRW